MTVVRSVLLFALGGYGFVATLQPDASLGRILAGYGGVFVVGSRSTHRLAAVISQT